MDKIGLIYCFHCIFTGKKYIGKSISISKRLQRHRANVKNNIISKFYNSVRKYGWGGFIFGIIEECGIEDLNEREIFYIEKYKTLTEGYNMTSGGDGGTTWEITDEIKNRYRERMLGFKHSEETKKKISEAKTGRKWSDEARKKLSKRCLGRKTVPMTQECREKLSKMRKGVPRSPEIIAKILETKKLNGSHCGKNNTNAKKFVFTSPQGEEYEVFGEFKKFCLNNELSVWGMKNFIKTAKLVPGCKNWTVKKC